MNPSTSEVQTEREVLLSRIRAWERELDEMSSENGRIVHNAVTVEDKKLIDHFENQFTIQINRLDQLKHQLKLSGVTSASEDAVKEFEGFLSGFRDSFIAFSEALM